MSKIHPRNKYILVRPEGEEARVSKHGIISPPSVEKESRAQGTVEAVGADIKDIKKGDQVIYGAFAGEKIKFLESSKEVDFVLLHDDDILAFIR